MKFIGSTATVLVGLASLAVIVTGCSSASPGAGTSSPGTTAVNAVFLAASDSTGVSKGLREGIEESITGAAGGSLTVASAGFDPAKQLQQCTAAVTSGRYNMIFLNPVQPPAAVPCVKAAEAASIPVITVGAPTGDSADILDKAQVSGVVGSVATGPKAAGDAVAELIAAACGDKNPCNVIADQIPGDVYTGTLIEEILKLPNVKIVQKISSSFDPSEMAKILPDALAAHPETDVVQTYDDPAIAAVGAVKTAGLTGKVLITGYGGGGRVAQAVKDGEIYGTTGSFPRTAGAFAGAMAIKIVNGQPVDQAFVDMDSLGSPRIVTPETVDQFTPEAP